MSYRRVIQCGAVTFFMMLSLSHPVSASGDDGRHDSEAEAESCGDPSTSTVDDGHGAGEQAARDEAQGDDCIISPPAEVSEAPKALLLSGSAVVTGGAAVLIIRRRSRGAHTAEA